MLCVMREGGAATAVAFAGMHASCMESRSSASGSARGICKQRTHCACRCAITAAKGTRTWRGKARHSESIRALGDSGS